MLYKKRIVIIFLFYFLLLPFTTFSQVPQEVKVYNLKFKLDPVTIKSKVYWQGKTSIGWQEDIKNWHFGLLPKEENIPPIIIDKENFYPAQEDYQGRYYWGKANMKFAVFNPLEVKIRANLLFSANSFWKDREVDIIINGENVKKIMVPAQKNEFSHFVIEGIILEPGENQMIFFIPGGTDRLEPNVWRGNKKSRQVSIKIKDNLRWEVISTFEPSSKLTPVEYSHTISDKNLSLLAYYRKEGERFLLMERDININLEEYPYLNFRLKLPDGKALKIFLGIDYSGDGKIDDYLNFEDREQLKEAKYKWRDRDIGYFKYGFILKKIIFIFNQLPDTGIEKDEALTYQLKDFNIYAQNLIQIPFWRKKNSDFEIADTHNLNYKTIFADNHLRISAYFDSKFIWTEDTEEGVGKQEVSLIFNNDKTLTGEVQSQDDKKIILKNVKELQNKSVIVNKEAISYYYDSVEGNKKRMILEDEYMDLTVPLSLEEKSIINSTTNFVLHYKLDDPKIQEVELFAGIDRDENGQADNMIILGKKELIKDFQFIDTRGDMAIYAADLSEEFPDTYSSSNKETGTKFVIYKDDCPLKLTWMEWPEGEELAQVGDIPRRVIISLPQGEFPQAAYSIFYLPYSKPSLLYNGYDCLEIPMEPYLGHNIRNIVIRIQRNKFKEAHGLFTFSIKEARLCNNFPYPAKDAAPEIFNLLTKSDIPLFKIDDKVFNLRDFRFQQRFENPSEAVLSKRIELTKGGHEYEKIENNIFNVKWMILEPAHDSQFAVHSKKEPQITFKRINSTKYLAKVQGAKEPFWLVFSETFDKEWMVYQQPEIEAEFRDVIADYAGLNVKETKHTMKISLGDVKFLFYKPLNAEHYLVNGYANGWYIDPQKNGLPDNFTLVLYFLPQSLFYFGFGISGVALLGCILYLIYGYFRRKAKNVKK